MDVYKAAAALKSDLLSEGWSNVKIAVKTRQFGEMNHTTFYSFQIEGDTPEGIPVSALFGEYFEWSSLYYAASGDLMGKVGDLTNAG